MKILASTLLFLGLTSGGAQAATIGYQLTIRGPNFDQPIFNILNTSSDALINSLVFTIGDTTHNFDRFFRSTNVILPTGGGITLNYGDFVNGGNLIPPDFGRYNRFELGFTGFDPGEVAQVQGEIDPDNFNQNLDFRTVFFNNGAAPNSVVTVGFSDGSFLSMGLADQTAGQASYVFAQMQTLAAVPLPASALFLGAGLLGLGLMRRRRDMRGVAA